MLALQTIVYLSCIIYRLLTAGDSMADWPTTPAGFSCCAMAGRGATARSVSAIAISASAIHGNLHFSRITYILLQWLELSGKPHLDLESFAQRSAPVGGKAGLRETGTGTSSRWEQTVARLSVKLAQPLFCDVYEAHRAGCFGWCLWLVVVGLHPGIRACAPRVKTDRNGFLEWNDGSA